MLPIISIFLTQIFTPILFTIFEKKITPITHWLLYFFWNMIKRFFSKASDAVSRQIKIGVTGTFKTLVFSPYTTNRTGRPGDDVLSSPSMVLLMELASINAIEPLLETDDVKTATFGYHLDIYHLARTDIGATVVAEAIVSDIKENKLTFDVQVYELLPNDEKKLIGKGKHRRAVVELEDL